MRGDKVQGLTGAGASAVAGGESDRRAATSGRVAALAALFCLVPPLLTMPQDVLAAVLPVVIAASVSSVLGLAGLSWRGPRQASAMAVLGLAALATGAVFNGLSSIAVGAAFLAIVLEYLGAARFPRPVLAAGAAVMALLVATLLVTPPPASVVAQGTVAVVLLPLAPLVTLALSMVALQKNAARGTRLGATAALRQDAMLAAAGACVLVTDRAAQVVDVGGEPTRLLADAAPALHGRGFLDRVLIADRPALLTAISAAVFDGAVQQMRVRVAVGALASAMPVPPDFKPFLIRVQPLDGARRQAALVVTVAPQDDVAETLLAVAGPELFSTVSHEVRTPMNAILGFSEILANPALAPSDPRQVAEYAAIIHRSARDAFTVTRALVDLLRVEAGEMAANPEHVYLAEVLGGVVAAVTSREPAGGCLFDIEAALADDAMVKADPRALRLLMQTLVDGLLTAQNRAVDFICAITSSEGRPTITMSARPRAGSDAATGDHKALLAMVELLARRLAGLIGATVEFDPPSGARVHFNAAAPVAVRHRRADAPPVNSLPPVPLRKSA